MYSLSGGERILGISPPWRERQFTRNEQLRTISYQFVRTLRLWNAIEGKKRDIIDFDLVPKEEPREESTEPSYDDFVIVIEAAPSKVARRIILEGLISFQVSLKGIPVPKDSREALQLDFFRADIDATIAYGRRRLGDTSMDGLSYIEATMGLKPEFITESVLAEQRDKVKLLFKAHDCEEYTREGIEQFRRKHQLPKNSISGHITHNADVFLRALSSFLGTECKPNFGIDVVEEDEYWAFWVNGSRDKFRGQVNVHRRHEGKWTLGKTQELPAHEIPGHMAQMDGWRRAIDRGELNPALGLTSVYAPEQVTIEGIAQTLPYFVPGIKEVFSDFGWLELEVTGLRNMVYNNIHIRATHAYESQMSAEEMENFVQEMIDYMHSYYPWESEEEVRKQIEARTTHPWKQVYLYSYGIGFLRHRQYAEALNNEGKRRLLHFVYSQPTTPKQEDDFVQALLHDPRGRFAAVKTA